MSYIGTQPVPRATRVRTFGSLSSSGTTIAVPGGFTPDNIEVFINGRYVFPTDYNDSDGFNIVFTETLDSGTDYVIMEARSFEIANHYTKLETDNKFADKTSGTAQDFATMPTVGGDPIVESGSNTDGEWTRWADGTQRVGGRKAFNGTGWKTSPFAQANFPIGFIDTPIDTVAAPVGPGGWTTAIKLDDATITANTVTVRPGDGVSDSGTSMRFRYISFGRWK